MFIVFEGGEGSGKSYQAKSLFKRLSKANIPAVLVHEPGGTALGKRLRLLLKREKMMPQTELLLFAAARLQLVNEVIAPALKQGITVVADRYAPSTLAYQGYGRGLNQEIISKINDLATQGIEPDLIVLLDIPAEEGLVRKKSPQKDRFEAEEFSFHQKVREGYLEMARAEPQKWLIVDGRLPKEEIAGIVWQRVKKLMGRQY